VARTAKLAGLPLGYAGRATWGLGRRIGGRPAELVAAEVQARTAEQVFKVLGELKGGAMKFGQAMSVFEAALPEHLTGPYRETLTKLQEAAPPLPARSVHRVLVHEFGDDWRDRFISFEDVPAAAASIGQVHRAVWADGRDVAVKVQYPGAGAALLGDLTQIGRLGRLIGVLVPGLDVKPLIAELKARVAEELDYTLEAASQTAFATAYADDPDVLVPGVVDGTERVLVSDWVGGTPLSRIIASGTPEQRDRAGLLLARFLFSGPSRCGLLHADPHPGNFRILPNEDGSPGKLGVLDYGAVARLPGRALPHAMGALIRIAGLRDPDELVAGLRGEGFIKPGVKLDPELVLDYLAPFVEPTQVERFRFTREWLQAQFQRLNNPKEPTFTLALKLNLPPDYLLIHRTWLGGVGVLSQLGAEAPFRQILTEYLPGFAG
jgi:predicted unusual protein kinase regulating ubiquinone biosynthesis (AarF/ABC1/UbiB family)